MKRGRSGQAGWLAVTGTGLAVLQYYLWGYGLGAWDGSISDILSVPTMQSGWYFLGVWVVLVWGFCDCSFTFVRLYVRDIKRGLALGRHQRSEQQASKAINEHTKEA